MTYVTDWSPYPYFRPEELRCTCGCGQVKVQKALMDMLHEVRLAIKQPLRVTSGYRCPNHPIEAAKSGRSFGEHVLGAAVDIACEGVLAHQLLRVASTLGVPRIGVNQKGKGRFIHLGIGGPGLASPWIWTY